MARVTLKRSGLLRSVALFAANVRQRNQDFRRDWRRLTPAERTDEIHQRLPHLVSIVALAGIVYYIARLGMILMLPVEYTAWRPPPLPVNTRTIVSDYSTIQAAHLFGISATESTPAVALSEVPATTLGLELHAVVASSNERFAHAIVSDESGHDEIYFLGATLPGGAMVANILSDRVILSRDGQLEALILPRVRDPNSLNTERGVWGANDSLMQDATAAPVIAETQPIARPVRLADIMMPRPRVLKGEFQGVQVFPGEHADRFTALGLVPGDLIIAIDGRKLTPNDAVAPFQGIAEGTDLTVLIERGGQKKSLHIVNGQSATAGAPTAKT